MREENKVAEETPKLTKTHYILFSLFTWENFKNFDLANLDKLNSVGFLEVFSTLENLKKAYPSGKYTRVEVAELKEVSKMVH